MWKAGAAAVGDASGAGCALRQLIRHCRATSARTQHPVVRGAQFPTERFESCWTVQAITVTDPPGATLMLPTRC
jgi:hypothetical protein